VRFPGPPGPGFPRDEPEFPSRVPVVPHHAPGRLQAEVPPSDLEGDEENYGFQIPRICEHCHRRILGRQYQIGKYFYDKYCYQFRWVIEKAHAEEDRKIELKKRKLLDDN